MFSRTDLAYAINYIGIFGLMGIVGGAIFIEFDLHETPCPLCLLQRLAMIMIAFTGLLNLRFGFRPVHFGLGILAAVFGGSVSLRQTFLHIVPGSPPGPSKPVEGYDLWWWAFLVFGVALVFIAIMLVLSDREPRPPKPNLLSRVAFLVVLLVAVGNVIITLKICGLGLCGE